MPLVFHIITIKAPGKSAEQKENKTTSRTVFLKDKTFLYCYCYWHVCFFNSLT